METNYVHWRNLTDTSHLRAEMFEPNKDMVLTIEKVVKEKVKDNKGNESTKPVAYFVEDVLPLVLNVTNCSKIEELFGTGNINEWGGRKIQLFATTTKVAGEPTPCIRVRNKLPQTSKPTYKCCVCGKEISEAVYSRSMELYGKAYCSKECHEQDVNGKDVL